MSQDRPRPWRECLAAAVADFRTERFQLGHELERLASVQAAGAPEAVVLYCSRILEVLAATAVGALELEPSTNSFANLEALQHYNLLPSATRHWAHALRRLGNSVRHVLGRVSGEDADLAALFAERWLDWFFRTFRFGQQLDAVTTDGQPLALSGNALVRELVRLLEALDEHLPAVLEDINSRPTAWLHTPVLPAALGEMLLDREECPAAFTLLNAGLAKFPDDLRLRQLLGLYWSRTGELDQARAWLEPLYHRYKDDEETAGIMAGLYKRMWKRERERTDWLEKSHRAYRQAWERTKRLNPYLGINAATTALWLGRRDEARQTAELVRESLCKRAGFLARHGGEPDLAFDYWDRVTLAEAELLRGETDVARRLYQDAFARHLKSQHGVIKVSREQLGEILEALGIPGGVDGFLSPDAGDSP